MNILAFATVDERDHPSVRVAEEDPSRARLPRNEEDVADDQKKELASRMKVFLPNDKLEFLIPLGADAVAAELGGR